MEHVRHCQRGKSSVKKSCAIKKIAWKRVKHEKTKNRGEFASFAPRIAQKKS